MLHRAQACSTKDRGISATSSINIPAKVIPWIRLAELAFGKANDCVKLALEEAPGLDKLDLSLLSEVKRNEKGTVEIKLVDRLQALEQLAELAGEDRESLESFFQALQAGAAE